MIKFVLKNCICHNEINLLDNSQFPQFVATAGNPGHCSHHLRLDICFNEYNYHDSLQARVIEEIGQWITFFK